MSISIVSIVEGYYKELKFYAELFNRLGKMIIPLDSTDLYEFKIANDILKDILESIENIHSISNLSGILDLQLLEDTWVDNYHRLTDRQTVVKDYNQYLLSMLEDIENCECLTIDSDIKFYNYYRYDQYIPTQVSHHRSNNRRLSKYYVIDLVRDNIRLTKGFSDNINLIKQYFRCRNIELDDPDYIIHEVNCKNVEELCNLHTALTDSDEFYSLVSYDGCKDIVISDSMEIDVAECEMMDSVVTDITECILMIYNLLTYLEDTNERKFLYKVFNKLKTLYLILIYICNNTDPELLHIEGLNLTCTFDILDQTYMYYYYGFEWEGIQIE